MICRNTHLTPTLFDWFLVDNFAGGGGASLGIERGSGRAVDLAINHDRLAVAMHRANHPQTAHTCQDVFDVDPKAVVPDGRPLAVWLSPDCTHHSKAKGGKPIRSTKTRSRDLSWVALKWAAAGAKLLFLENVEEYQGWGPLCARRCPKTGRVMKFNGKVAAAGEWVPLDDQMLVPRKKLKGRAFRLFVKRLRGLGYTVQWRELRGCDYGTPTIRKRLFMIARNDGQPIIWPEKTHGPEQSQRQRPSGAGAQDRRNRQAGATPFNHVLAETPGLGSGKGFDAGQGVHSRSRSKAKPYRTAAECIDFSLSCPSIFTRKRPLVPNTCKRIAKGIKKHVTDSQNPYIVEQSGSFLTEHANGSNQRNFNLNEPLRTVCAKPKGGSFGLVSPTLIQTGYGERKGQAPRAPGLGKPLGTVVGTGKHALVAAWMVKHFGGVVGCPIDAPSPTQTTRGTQNQLAACHLTHMRGTNKAGGPIDVPAPTIAAQGNHHGLVAAFLSKYYGADQHGQGLQEAIHTIPTKERFALVNLMLESGGTNELPAGFWRVWQFLITYMGDEAPVPIVVIDGEIWLITDIGMRMLAPRELYRCMGFPDSYIIDHGIDADGSRVTINKTNATKLCGNSVAVDVVEAIVKANLHSGATLHRAKQSERKESHTWASTH